MILYLSVLVFPINPSNTFLCNFLQIDVFYQGPPVIYSELYLSISYCICSCVSIIYNIPTWCKIVFNTKFVIISWYVVSKISTSIVFSFPQLLHLIAILFLNHQEEHIFYGPLDPVANCVYKSDLNTRLRVG